MKIVESIKENTLSTEITLSIICLRENDPSLNKKRITLNNQIESLPSDYGLKVINNAIIDNNCFSRKKLYLNHPVGWYIKIC